MDAVSRLERLLKEHARVLEVKRDPLGWLILTTAEGIFCLEMNAITFTPRSSSSERGAGGDGLVGLAEIPISEVPRGTFKNYVSREEAEREFGFEFHGAEQIGSRWQAVVSYRNESGAHYQKVGLALRRTLNDHLFVTLNAGDGVRDVCLSVGFSNLSDLSDLRREAQNA